MLVLCPGWPAPHVPPVVLTEGDGPVSHGLCSACDAVFAITQAQASSPRLARFVARLTNDLTPKEHALGRAIKALEPPLGPPITMRLR